MCVGPAIILWYVISMLLIVYTDSICRYISRDGPGYAMIYVIHYKS